MSLRGWITSASLGAAVFVGAICMAQNEERTAPEPGSEDAWMAALEKAGAPGEHHKHLEPLVGTWDQVVRWRMDPQAPWEETPGTSEYYWIMGGRFLAQKVKSPPMMEGGPPFEGFGLIGYDNLRKRHMSMWVDNMSTSLMISEGPCSQGGKVMSFVGTSPDPFTGKEKESKTVLRIINDNEHMIEMYYPTPEGGEFKTMEILYTRKG